MAGGVALNAVANARVLREAGFDRVFVQPAAGDAGGALGAAILGALSLGDRRPAPLETAALGQEVSGDEALAVARELGLCARTASDPDAAIVDRLERGEVVAVARGRFEWGPRALGQRSILALPSTPGVRDRLNRAIKKREAFRPFAPAVLEDRAAEWFACAPNDMTPFMTAVCPAHDPQSAALAAAVHVDGSARVQTVAACNALAGVLDELERRGHPPVVLNTSLNGPGDPIAASATDVIAFACGHAVDALVVGDLVVERPSGAAA
jgi:carbamoyltransferase